MAPADGLLTKEEVSSMEITSSVILMISNSIYNSALQFVSKNNIINYTTIAQPPLRGGMTAILSELFKITVSSRSMYVSFKASIRHDESGSKLKKIPKKLFKVN